LSPNWFIVGISHFLYFREIIGGFTTCLWTFEIIAWLLLIFLLAIIHYWVVYIVYSFPKQNYLSIFITSVFRHPWCAFPHSKSAFSVLFIIYQILEFVDSNKLVQFTTYNQDVIQVYHLFLVYVTRSHSCVVKCTCLFI